MEGTMCLDFDILGWILDFMTEKLGFRTVERFHIHEYYGIDTNTIRRRIT